MGLSHFGLGRQVDATLSIALVYPRITLEQAAHITRFYDIRYMQVSILLEFLLRLRDPPPTPSDEVV